MTNLRIATDKDAADVYELALKFTEEFDLPKAEEISVADNFFNILQNPKASIIILAEKENKTIGMIIGVVTKPLFSSIRIATEIAWYVNPEDRKTKASLELLKAYDYWAKNIAKCDMVQLMHLNTDRLGKVYERLGYKQREVVYDKWL